MRSLVYVPRSISDRYLAPNPRAFGEIAKRHTKMVSVCKERTLAAYDGHSHLMWDTAAVFCFKRSPACPPVRYCGGETLRTPFGFS